MNPEDRVKELNLELPPPPKPAGVYKPVVVVGNMAYVSGHGPLKPDGTMMTGRVGADVDKDGSQALWDSKANQAMPAIQMVKIAAGL